MTAALAALANIFDLNQAVLVTTDYHMPRALFLCNVLGIDSIGAATVGDHLHAAPIIF